MFCKLQTPSTDSYGTLTYLGGGQYKYVFATDITKVKAFVDASTDPIKADVGDTTYDASLPTRVVIQIAGAARGTGTNTADGVQVAPAVNLGNPLNLVWNSTAPQRDIVAIESCNNCHSALAFHGSGARVDTDYCVVCHTNQRKYNADGVRARHLHAGVDDGSTEVVPSWNTEPRKFPDGNAMRDFPIMVHSIHAGEQLPVRRRPAPASSTTSTRSRSRSRWATASVPHRTGPNATPQGDNWKNNPSRIACGACHNNINFVDRRESPGRGRCAGRRQQVQDLPHARTAIATVYHVSVDPTGSVDRGGYPVNTANNVPTPGYASGHGPGDSAGLVDEPAGRRAQGRASRSARSPSRPTRRRSSTASCSTVRRSRSCRPARSTCSPTSTARRSST